MASKKTNKDRKKNVVREREDRAREILKALGLWTLAKETKVADRLLQAYDPRVTVKLSETAGRTAETDRIQKVLNGTINRTTFDCGPLGTAFPIQDYFTIVLPIAQRIQVMRPHHPRMVEFLQSAREQVGWFTARDFMSQAFHILRHRLDDELVQFCRIDSQIYHLTPDIIMNKHNSIVQSIISFILNKDAPRVRRIMAEGKPRPAYWCGGPNGSGNLEWIEWPRPSVGLPEDGPPLPVFVQSHALDNLYRKEARALFVEGYESYVHAYLVASLLRPKLSRMPGRPGRFLVEYWFNIYKLGYLIARPVDDVVLIESFLFLTMNGTPEGDLLWEKLRLRKEDKRFLSLDRIQAFLWSDIQFDPELVSLLEQCGCGHLFRILKEPPTRYVDEGYARDLRKYLRLDEKDRHRHPCLK
jgi:hypothetical protein